MKRNLQAGKLQSGGFGFNVFTDDELNDIHLSTLKVLKKTGGKDLTERAYEEAWHVLENHKPLLLPDGAAETMSSIIEDYEAELKVNRK